MRETQAYKEDWLGLNTLDKAGKLKFVQYEGQHVAIPKEIWDSEILPLLGPTSTNGNIKKDAQDQGQHLPSHA